MRVLGRRVRGDMSWLIEWLEKLRMGHAEWDGRGERKEYLASAAYRTFSFPNPVSEGNMRI